MTVVQGTRTSRPAEPTPTRTAAFAPWITLAARLGLTAVWFWAGTAKIQYPDATAQAVRAYQILPESAVKPVGYGLPFFELALGLLLLLGLGTRIAAVLSGALFLLFIAGIASVWARGLTIDCGCFGGGGQVAKDQTHYLQEILRDSGFLLMAAWIAWRPRHVASLDRYLLGE